MNTISDEILIRLLCLSEGKPVQGFPVREIRIHLKNYFDHMCPNFDNVTNAVSSGGGWQHQAGLYLGGGGDYLHSADNVKDMLEQARMLLANNEKKWFPK